MGKRRRRTPKIKWVNINGTMQPLIEEEDEVPPSAAMRLIPVSAVFAGGFGMLLLNAIYPQSDLKMYGLFFLVGFLGIPIGYFLADRLFKLLERRILPAQLRAEMDLKKYEIAERLKVETIIRTQELANERLHLSIKRAEIHLRHAMQDASIHRLIQNGATRIEAPEVMHQYDIQRQRWQMEVVGVLFSPEHTEKTKKGTWTGGQPVSMKKLGRKRYGLLKDAGLIYESGKHAQWKYEEAPDEHSAMTALERIGAFEITEAWG